MGKEPNYSCGIPAGFLRLACKKSHGKGEEEGGDRAKIRIALGRERLFPDRPTGWMVPRNVTKPCKGTLYNCVHPDSDRWKKKKQCSLRRYVLQICSRVGAKWPLHDMSLRSGHLEPLGNQINHLKCLKHEYTFDPRHFVEHYMRKQRPVLLKVNRPHAAGFFSCYVAASDFCDSMMTSHLSHTSRESCQFSLLSFPIVPLM